MMGDDFDKYKKRKRGADVTDGEYESPTSGPYVN